MWHLVFVVVVVIVVVIVVVVFVVVSTAGEKGVDWRKTRRWQTKRAGGRGDDGRC